MYPICVKMREECGNPQAEGRGVLPNRQGPGQPSHTSRKHSPDGLQPLAWVHPDAQMIAMQGASQELAHPKKDDP